MIKKKGWVKIEKLISKSEFAKGQNLTPGRITQMSDNDDLPFNCNVIKFNGGEIIELP